MYTNGKFEGDDAAIGQMNAQFGFSAIPSLFVNHFDRALLIGLGLATAPWQSNILATAKSISPSLRPESWRRLDTRFPAQRWRILMT